MQNELLHFSFLHFKILWVGWTFLRQFSAFGLMKNDDDGKRFLPWLCGMFSSLLFCSNSAKVLFLVYIHFDISFFSQFIPKSHVAILNHDILTSFACYTSLKYSRGWQANLDLINNVRFKKKIGSTSKKWEQKKSLMYLGKQVNLQFGIFLKSRFNCKYDYITMYIMALLLNNFN